MQKVVIQIDEMKPHQAESLGFLRRAEEELGMRNIKLQGSFDDKLTYIYGEVEDFQEANSIFNPDRFGEFASFSKVS